MTEDHVDPASPAHAAPTLAALGADVGWPDGQASPAAVDATSLGGLSAWLARTQAAHPPRELRRVRALMFGVAELDAGELAVADLVGAGARAIAPLSGSIADAIAAGAAVVDVEVDSGADLLVVGAPAGGSRVAAAVVTSLLADAEPVKVLPRGTTLDPQAWIELAVAVRDGRRAALDVRDSVDDLLAAVSDRDLAAMTACLLRAAGRRTPVLIDGPPAAAAALLAHAVQPRVALWLRAADQGCDPAQRLALERADVPAVLAMGTDGSAMTAGLIAVTALRAAALCHPRGGSADV